MKCPMCQAELERDVCGLCGDTFNEERLRAIQDSVRMHTIAINERVVKIINGDGRQIRAIFHEEDRAYNRDRIVWIITNAQLYNYVPCIRTAFKALRQQHMMWT